MSVTPDWGAVPVGIKVISALAFVICIAVGNFLLLFWPVILLIALWQVVTTPLRAIGDAIEARTIGRLVTKLEDRFGSKPDPAEIDEGAQLAVLYWLKWSAIAGLVAGVLWGMSQHGIPYITGGLPT